MWCFDVFLWWACYVFGKEHVPEWCTREGSVCEAVPPRESNANILKNQEEGYYQTSAIRSVSLYLMSWWVTIPFHLEAPFACHYISVDIWWTERSTTPKMSPGTGYCPQHLTNWDKTVTRHVTYMTHNSWGHLSKAISLREAPFDALILTSKSAHVVPSKSVDGTVFCTNCFGPWSLSTEWL